MAQTLGSVAVGTVVKINENGSPVNYLVVHQGLPSAMYDASCDGTWVLREDIYKTILYSSEDKNRYFLSKPYIESNTMKNSFDLFIQKAMKPVKPPTYYGNGNDVAEIGPGGLQCYIFILSAIELGYDNYRSADGNIKDGSTLNYFKNLGNSAETKRIARYNGNPYGYVTRTPVPTKSGAIHEIKRDGGCSPFNTLTFGPSFMYTTGFRPAFILPQDLYVESDGSVVNIPPSTIKVDKLAIMQGSEISVSWSSVPDADSYLLQRKVDSGEWEQVYAGADPTYTDTSGSWSTVQYRVCGVFEGVNGAFAQSDVITVLPASALVISGTDGNLGTITSDIPYSVATDTGNQISLTRTVNGVLVASLTVNSGFPYNIPVMDLPTGTGTIVITATVETDSDPVTVTRTWTYTKAAQTFPNVGGLAQLAKDGQDVFPMTLAEAVKTIGGPWGGNMSTALDKLALAAVFNREVTPKYTEVKVDLSKVQPGDIVNLPENGAMVPFYVASLDYEPTLNTGGTRVLLVRKDVYQNGHWNSSGVNTYANSTIDNWFNNTYKPMLDSTVLAEIGETTFYYTPGGGNDAVTPLARSIFALSVTELGFYNQYANAEGNVLSVSDLLKTVYFNGLENTQWTRTPLTSSGGSTVWFVNVGNSLANNGSASVSVGYRPCFTLPATFSATFYVDTNGTVHAAQEYAQDGSFADLWGNIIPTAKIETGSYVGTGAYGANSPNAITASFPIKAAIISYDGGGNGPWYETGIFANIVNESEFTTSLGYGYFILYAGSLGTISSASSYTSGNTLFWYSTVNSAQQLNTNATPYKYILLG